MRWFILAALVALGLAGPAPCRAEDRDAKVRRDRRELSDHDLWIYNDLERARRAARESGRPLLVVVRCIPCEACSQFDRDLLADQQQVRDLLEEFVCVRVVQANGLDLNLFQFDYDQSFHALMLHADGTLYGRYGTRSARPEKDDMTLAGLRQALAGALELHAGYPANKASLAGKQGRPVKVRVPEELPSLRGKYTAQLDYQGNVVGSCIHCHQIRDAERLAYRQGRQPWPDQVLYPYPLPDVLGLRMNPDQRATVVSVAAGSIAAHSGLQPGDELVSLAGQVLLSTADLQWVLHQAPSAGDLSAQVRRQGQILSLTLRLPDQWRTLCDLSWRPTTWDLRRMAAGGLVLEDLAESERAERGLEPQALALRVKHVGQYGDHAVALRAGFQKDDLIVRFDDRAARLSESQFLAQALTYPPGHVLQVEVLRGRQTKRLKLPLQ